MQFVDYQTMDQLQTRAQVIDMIKTAPDNIELLEELLGLNVENDPITFVIMCLYACGVDHFSTNIFADMIDKKKRVEVVEPIMKHFRQATEGHKLIADPEAIYAKYGADKIWEFFDTYATGNSGLTVEDLRDAGPEDTYEEDLVKAGVGLKRRVLSLIMADLADSVMMRFSEAEDIDLARIQKVLDNA